MSKIMISELQETTSAPDSSYIAIDNGTATNKITIANYNTNANATAKSYAEASQRYSNDALTAKDGAVSAKNEAETLANTASSYANAARASADAAAGSASEASGYVGSAQASATNALASARAAEASAAGIDDQVKLAKSWAVGNTGVRANEAVDNAMYWAGQAAAAAGGGVVSFNGRTGSVLPNAGDYSSDQIAHVNSDSTYTNVETALNEAQTNIANKLNYYSSAPTQWDTAPTANSTKPVTSGGLKIQFDAVTNEFSDITNILGAKNILDPYYKLTGAWSGITWTYNSDGSLTASGTPSDEYASYSFCSTSSSDTVNATVGKIFPKAGKYVASLGDELGPSGSGALGFVEIYKRENNTKTSVFSSLLWNEQKEVLVEITDTMINDTSYFIAFEARVYSTVSNVHFYPMIRPASIIDDTYAPFVLTNRQLTDFTNKVTNTTIPMHSGETGSANYLKCGKLVLMHVAYFRSSWTANTEYYPFNGAFPKNFLSGNINYIAQPMGAGNAYMIISLKDAGLVSIASSINLSNIWVDTWIPYYCE